MNNKLATLIFSLIALGSVYSLGQSKADPPGEVVITGTVTSFEVGKSIEIDAKGVSHKYDLNNVDILYSISPEVATGTTVTATERTDANGHKTVNIALAAKPAKQ